MKKDKHKNKKGKILRVKQGYNPNSSSIGSIVFAIPITMMGALLSFSVISTLIMSVLGEKKNKDKKSEGVENNEDI